MELTVTNMQEVLKVDAQALSVGQILSQKYTLDYYQREYRWERKHITELLSDLEEKFLSNYDSSHTFHDLDGYSHYFLGALVISRKEGMRYIIDGQQRLTTLTLILIYLHHLQIEQAIPESERTNLHDLIFSTRRKRRSFNLDVPERADVMNALFKADAFDPLGQSESVQNVYARYQDIEDLFPDSLKDATLPYFIDWFTDNVDMVEITAFTDEEAYTIFETMNDRGLSLRPIDMLSGYLLSNITDNEGRAHASEVWRKRSYELNTYGKDSASAFMKAWLRAKYAHSIRSRKKGAVNRDYEKISANFHRWLRDHRDLIGLQTSEDFYQFITNKFDRFAHYYALMRESAIRFNRNQSYIYYNAFNDFTLQFSLALAPLLPEDDMDTVQRKIRLVTGYVDILLARRLVNFRTRNYAPLIYSTFDLMQSIRDLDVYTLADVLYNRVMQIPEDFSAVSSLHLRAHNKRTIHYLLARMTYHIEQESGTVSNFTAYVSRKLKRPFEIEHILADKYQRHSDEFDYPDDFAGYRNQFGGLLLVPSGFNQSYGDLPYREKVEHYRSQNLLAWSLHESCYQHNPSFLDYVKRSNLPFRPHTDFKMEDMDSRQHLYRLLCEEIWSPSRFERELG